MQRLKREGYTNIEVRFGNGYSGWSEHAPFDKVIVTAAPDPIPPPLINQLKAGGRMLILVGLPNAEQLAVSREGLERQGHDEGNYAGTVFVTRRIRPAFIPAVLIKMFAGFPDDKVARYAT